MGLTYSSVVCAEPDEVFGWHSRPGAMTRLMPPWQPVRVVREAPSVRDGQAVLALPGGLRWVAQHQAEFYDPPSRFVDTISSDGLASLPARIAVRWRHIHDFEDADHNRTRVIDRGETPVPARALRSMFVYRHRQLADDLRVHREAAGHGGFLGMAPEDADRFGEMGRFAAKQWARAGAGGEALTAN